MSRPKLCACKIPKDRRYCGLLTVAFGLGLVSASICPYGLTLFITAVILVALGVTIICG